MEILSASIVFCFALYLFFQERSKRKVAFVAHLQGRTEEAETMDFAVSLFEDESQAKWTEKIYKAFDIMEARRAFQNKRIQEMHEKFRKEHEAKQKEQEALKLAKKA